jgi:4-amino-4-deoxy-L-arabinose transferase-like glycosyltransferase
MTGRNSLYGNLKKNWIIWIGALALPALFINLDMLPLIGDEAIRALVSIEMILSGDYLTPTLNGELYFNKPPLFNWILVFIFKIFSNNSEFFVRLPTTLFLILYCYTIFWWVRKQLGSQMGMLAALMFLTCGRILFWDSFLGLIDITFSWILFLNFMIIWHSHEKQRFLQLFLVSYLLIAVSFLLKGLPSLVFQGITLLTLFIYKKNFKKLFSWQHILSIFIFCIITGTYYYLYFLRHPDDTGKLILRLFTESTQKSAFGTEIKNTILHLFTFPFELVYHFVPWTLLVIFIFNRKIFTRVFANDFIRYCSLVFIANLIIYWLSPITYPRYLLMLFPLAFTIFLYLVKYHAILNTDIYRIFTRIISIIMVLLVLCNALLPVVFAHEIPVDNLFSKALIILIAGVIIWYYFYYSQKKANILFTLALVLLLSRISFDIFLVPYRQINGWANLCRFDAIRLTKETEGKELFVLTDTITIPNAYYITRERNEILQFREFPVKGPYYLVDDPDKYGNNFKTEYSMRIPNHRKRRLYAGKFITDP